MSSALTSLRAEYALGTPAGRITRTLSERGMMSAAQLARFTGLAKSTVSTALSELRQSGMVREIEGFREKSAGAGRPAKMLTLNPEAGTCVGLMIGQGVIQLVLADVSHAVIASVTEEVSPDLTPADAARITKELIAKCYTEHSLSPDRLLGVGIAIVAPVGPHDGRVLRGSALPSWTGVDLRHVFEPVLERPVYAANESNCSAIAEMMWGAARGFEDFILFKIDGGIGGAIVHRGVVITGVAGSAGEFGHMVMEPTGELCRCGNRGCFERTAGFRAILARAGVQNVSHSVMNDVIMKALAGDAHSQSLVEQTAAAAGIGLALIGTIINPPLIVIGGRLAITGQMLLRPLTAAYHDHCLMRPGDVSDYRHTRIVTGAFTENDACLGAVGLVLRNYRGAMAH